MVDLSRGFRAPDRAAAQAGINHAPGESTTEARFGGNDVVGTPRRAFASLVEVGDRNVAARDGRIKRRIVGCFDDPLIFAGRTDE